MGEHQLIKDVRDDINANYLSKFAFEDDALSSRIQIAPEPGLQPFWSASNWRCCHPTTLGRFTPW